MFFTISVTKQKKQVSQTPLLLLQDGIPAISGVEFAERDLG